MSIPGVSTDIETVITPDTDTTFAGESWRAFPFEFDADVEDDSGELAGARLSVSNVLGEWNGLVDGAGGLEGQPIVVWRAHTSNLTASAAVSQTFEIVTTKRTDKAISFSLGRRNFFTLSTPRDYYRRDTCGVAEYKNDQCKYAGQTRAITTITNSGGLALVTTSTAHGLDNLLIVVVSGNSVSGYNGTWSIDVVSATTFRLVGSTYTSNGAGGTAGFNRPSCDRTTYGSNGCIAHDNIAQFRGFPCIPRPL
jgi:hypothetical protein